LFATTDFVRFAHLVIAGSDLDLLSIVDLLPRIIATCSWVHVERT
jgi:hypothetical protein